MSFDFSKFDEEFAGMVEDVSNVDTDGEFEDIEIPHGKYEVEVAKLTMVETKTPPPRPMMSVWFRIIAGEYKGQMIFMNQMLTHPYPIAIARDFVKSLEPTTLTDDEITFNGYEDFAELLITAYEGIEGKREYVLDYSKNKKDYDVFEIEEVFEI